MEMSTIFKMSSFQMKVVITQNKQHTMQHPSLILTKSLSVFFLPMILEHSIFVNLIGYHTPIVYPLFQRLPAFTFLYTYNHRVVVQAVCCQVRSQILIFISVAKANRCGPSLPMENGTYFSQPPPSAAPAKTCGRLFCTTCEKFLLTVQVSFDKWHLVGVYFMTLFTVH